MKTREELLSMPKIELKDYKIYKQRAGRNFEEWGVIYAENYEQASQEFAKEMTYRFHEEDNMHYLEKGDTYSGNIKVKIEGWYDVLNGELIYSKKEIEKGFDSFEEDVYRYELRDYEEVEEEEEEDYYRY